MYLRRNGWTDHDSFSVRTAAGEIRPRIDGPRPARWTWAARGCAPRRLPAGRRRRHRHAQLGRARVRLPVRVGRQPAVLDRGRGRPRGARPPALRRRRSSATSCSRTARTCRSGAAPATPRSARASSSAGWGRRCRPGTGATGAAVAAVLRGVDSPVTVRLDGGELEVEVGEDLHVDLTGWARARVRAAR